MVVIFWLLWIIIPLFILGVGIKVSSKLVDKVSSYFADSFTHATDQKTSSTPDLTQKLCDLLNKQVSQKIAEGKEPYNYLADFHCRTITENKLEIVYKFKGILSQFDPQLIESWKQQQFRNFCGAKAIKDGRFETRVIGADSASQLIFNENLTQDACKAYEDISI